MCWNQDTVDTLINAGAGLLGAGLGSLITWLAFTKGDATQRELAEQSEVSQSRATLDGLVLKMLEFAMEYPYLEKDGFPASYPDCKGHPHCKERYETYCCFVFNTLEFMFRHFSGDRRAIENYFHIREVVKAHYRIWQADKENLEYDADFRQYIQSIIDELRKKGEIQ